MLSSLSRIRHQAQHLRIIPKTRSSIRTTLSPGKVMYFWQTLYGLNSTTVADLSAHVTGCPISYTFSIPRVFAEQMQNSAFYSFLAEVNLHFLSAWTVASNSDLTWHNIASFLFILYFCFYLPSRDDKIPTLKTAQLPSWRSSFYQQQAQLSQIHQKVLLWASQLTIRAHFASTSAASRSQSLHTLLFFDGHAQLRASRPRVDKQLLISRSNWFPRQYR